jgi:hypothetical protein
MDATAQFVSDLSVARFVDRLRLERAPTLRASLQRLLFKELENLIFNSEQLGNVEGLLTEGMRQIEIQKAAIGGQKLNPHDVGLAENTLGNPVEIQRIFERCRQAILDHINRDGSIGKTPSPGSNSVSTRTQDVARRPTVVQWCNEARSLSRKWRRHLGTTDRICPVLIVAQHKEVLTSK